MFLTFQLKKKTNVLEQGRTHSSRRQREGSRQHHLCSAMFLIIMASGTGIAIQTVCSLAPWQLASSLELATETSDLY